MYSMCVLCNGRVANIIDNNEAYCSTCFVIKAKIASEVRRR